MTYQEIMNALDMIWDEKPRLDIRACRDEAYNLLDPALKDLAEYTWASIGEQLADFADELDDEQLAHLDKAIMDAAGFGIDLYLGCALAKAGKLTATGHGKVQTAKALKSIEQDDVQLAILERFDWVPLILRDFASDRLESLTEEVEELRELPWELTDSIRQNLLALSTTSFLITSVHLENAYKTRSKKEKTTPQQKMET